jgi:pre-60S factor REI1
VYPVAKSKEEVKPVSALIMEEDKPGSSGTSKLVAGQVEEEMEEPVEEGDSDDSDWESMSEGEEEEVLDLSNAIPVTTCLFCPIESPTLDKNVEHMTRVHSFFIPDIEYLTDVEGLLTYLGEKVGAGLRCLWCCDSGKGFKSVRSVQRHMQDKGHCKMRQEAGDTLLEFVDFYDYSTSYPDAEQGTDRDEEVALKELDVNDDLELVLPSGAVVGHRSLARYFRQNLRPTPLEPKRKSRLALDKVMSQYRALGWTGTSGAAAIRKARDFKAMKKVLDKRWLKLGLTNNIQHHYRQQYNIIG